MNIKELLFNPTQFTIKDIQELISSGDFDKKEVASVLQEDVFKYVDKIPSQKQSLSSLGPIKIPKESNIVMLWGRKGAGKTSLVGSILSIKGFSPQRKSKEKDRKRFKALSNIFGKDGWQKIYDTTDDGSIETINTNYKPHLFGRSYPISFIEIDSSLDWDWPIWDYYLTSSLNECNGHIHIFCLDCSYVSEISLKDSLEQQVNDFNSILDCLKERDFLDTANAIYVVVTKADMMRVPKSYLDNAAQTLVTSSLSSFWQRIRNICYDKQIYNAQPLTSSVGDFALKDLVYLNAEYTQRLFYENILEKCYPKKLLIEGLFDYSKWWIKWIVVSVVVLVVIWSAYQAVSSLIKSPKSAIIPFDYTVYFQKELKAFHEVQCDEAMILYERLYYDLLTEREIRSDSGEAIISDSVGLVCDSMLTTTFAPILKQACEEFFNTNNWSRQTERINHMKRSLKLIHKNKYLSSWHNDYFTARQKNLTDLRMVKGLIMKSNHCKSLGDVEDIRMNYKKWEIYPFTNDHYLNSGLSNAVRNACESCTDYYCQKADEYLSIYDRDNKYIYKDKYQSDYEQKMASYNAKIKLKNNTYSLRNNMDDLIDYIDFYDLKSKLIAKKRNITDITSNAEKPQRSFWDLF